MILSAHKEMSKKRINDAYKNSGILDFKHFAIADDVTQYST